MKNTNIIVLSLSAVAKAKIAKGCKTVQVVAQVASAAATIVLGVMAINETLKSGKE